MGIKEERHILCMQRLFSVLRSNHALAHIRRRYPEEVGGYARQRIARRGLRNHRNMRLRQRLDHIGNASTERPAHYTYKGLIHLRQLLNLLCNGCCISSLTSRVCNQQAHLDAIGQRRSIVKFLLRDIGTLQIVSSNADGGRIASDHGGYYNRNVGAA